MKRLAKSEPKMLQGINPDSHSGHQRDIQEVFTSANKIAQRWSGCEEVKEELRTGFKESGGYNRQERRAQAINLSTESIHQSSVSFVSPLIQSLPFILHLPHVKLS